MRPVVGVRHHLPHELGVVAEVLEEAGIPHRYFDAWRDPDWPDLDRVSGLVVLGGEMNADEIARYPFLAAERALLRRAAREGVPVLGICLGAQLLARAFDAPVTPSPALELGFSPITTTPEGSVDPVLSPFDRVPVFQWHADTFEIPSGAVHLARGERVANQAFRIGHSCYAVQFHPEATLHGIAAWIDRWKPDVRRAGRDPDDLFRETERALPVQAAASRSAFRAFVELVAERG
jgi:GMP synthase (glutamine-hydrolysing)